MIKTWFVVMLPLIACAPAPIDVCASVISSAASLELHAARKTAGQFELIPLSDVAGPAELILWEGAQGGYHVWGALHAIGLYPGTAAERRGDSDGFPLSPVAEYSLVSTSSVGGGQTIEAEKSFQMPLLRGEGGDERLGDWVVLNPRERLEFLKLEGQQATYSAKVTDTCGTTVEDTLSVTLNPMTLEEQMDL